MTNIAQFVQMIATAINVKMTRTLADRIQSLSAGMQTGGKTWVERTPAARAVQDRRISASNNAVSSATKEHADAKSEAMRTANDFLQEQLNPTGRDLAALAKTAEHYRKVMEEAADSLADVTRQNERIKAESLSTSHRRQIERSSEAVDSASAYRSDAQNRFSSVRAAVTEEETNPTGMDPVILAQMKHAADVYRLQLEEATENLGKVTGEHERLRQAIDQQIAAVKGLTAADIDDLKSASERTSKSAESRNSIQDKYNQSRQAVTDEYLNPTGMDPQKLKRLSDAVIQYERDLEAADVALKKSVTAEERMQRAVLARAGAQQSAESRQPTTKFGQAARRVNVAFKKLIGSRGRKALKPFTKRVQQARDAINPKKAKERLAKARDDFKTKDTAFRKTKSAFNQAKAEHDKANELHQRSPSAASQQEVARTGKNLGAAESAMNTAGKAAAGAGEELAAAEAMGAIAEAAGGLAGALGPVGIAIGAVAVTAVAAVAYINKQLAAGKQEVERFRSERSRFSGQMASAVNRYDLQSLHLEQRSSRATAGSATGVVESTMRLRESNQGRSEQWEMIANSILEQTIATATVLSDIFNAVDFITPTAKTLVGLSGDTLKLLGVKLGKIDENTKKTDANLGINVIREFNGENWRGKKDKEFPNLPPIK